MTSALRYWVEQEPNRVALIDGERSSTRAELDQQTNQIARALAGRGVGPDDLVAISMPNSIEFYEAALAVWKLGATPMPISSRMPADERNEILSLARPKLGLTNGESPDADARTWIRLEPGFATSHSSVSLPDRIPKRIRAIRSGGTTGRPKVVLSKRPGLHDPTRPFVASFGSRTDGCNLVTGPLYHGGPFAYSTHGLLSGNTIVISRRFDAAQTLELIERHRVDWVPLVPTMMSRILKLGSDVLGSYDLSSLQAILHFAAACPRWLKSAWIEMLGPNSVWEVYGGAEGQANTVINGREYLEHPGSVGRTYSGKIRVLDEAGADVLPGVEGEIFMMPDGGPGSTYEYLGAEPATRDGWESLGDLGYLDAEGWLYLADRRTNKIVCGGVNIYPAEIEAVLDAHPGVTSSAVTGLPDDDMGEIPAAVVHVREGVTVEQLDRWVRSRLSGPKCPRRYHLQATALHDDRGKVRRSALAALFAVSDPAVPPQSR
jgi:bile acid-coenzyme A ligase